MSGVIHVKDGSTWKSVNFGGAKVWVNHSGTWKEPTGVWVKHSGTWKKVYPSTTEAWTTANRPTELSRQTTSNPPNLSTDPTYVYTNLLSANSPVRWSGRASDTGQWIRAWNYGWSPTLTAGFKYGAITRMEVTFEARGVYVMPGSETFRIEVGPQLGTAFQTSNLTTGLTVYTLDKTIADWGLTNEEAGNLHLSPSSSNSIQVTADYDNASGASQDVEIEDVKCRIKYLSN